MKIYLALLLTLCLYASVSSAQEVTSIAIKKTTDTIKERASLVDTTKGKPTTYDCSTIDKLRSLDIKKQDNGSYLFAITDDKGSPVSSFTIFQFNQQLYKDKITAAINKLCNDTSNSSRTAAIATLTDQATYDKILEASLLVGDVQQTAGTLKIYKGINFFALDDKGQPKKQNTLTVYDIQVQFQDGFIENLIVHGKIEGVDSLLKFENFYPIAFSTKRNFQRLRGLRLYEKTVYINSGQFINVGELLEYNQNLHPYAKDYFPDNQVYKADITDSVTSVNLDKENTSKILAVQVFSDLKGTGDSPNGLIQVDFSKKLNLLTQRLRFPWSFSTNYGVLNYFTPEFTLSKVEDNKRNLILSYKGNSTVDPSKPNTFATTLDLLQYQQYCIGGKLNLLSLDVPSLKSTFFINGGFRYGRTAIQDTIRTLDAAKGTFSPIKDNNLLNYGVNTFQIIPEVQWEIYPDERYGFIFSQQFNHLSLLADKFHQIDEPSRYADFLKTFTPVNQSYAYKKWMASSEIQGFFKPSTNNQLFIRYRLNWDLENAKNNFNQIQVGIMTYLTSTSESKTNK